MSIDTAAETFKRLAPAWLANRPIIETEQDARFQVIDRMIREVLGWADADVRTEPSIDGGYLDYLLSSDGRSRCVIEAKRAGNLLIASRQPGMNSYKVNGPALKPAHDALIQAQTYCVRTGTTFAAVTTGFEWIAFWATRSDGRSPYEGKAIVFPNLEAIGDNFSTFHDLFSKRGVLDQLYQVHIHEVEGLQIVHAETLEPVLPTRHLHLVPKSKAASDLEPVLKQFFSVMTGERDLEMLEKCFVESKESREADISLQKILQNLTNDVEVVGAQKAVELQEHIRGAVETQRGEFVLIVGNKGAGKSTFIDRFFNLVLDRRLKEKCLLIKVDLADSDGNPATITDWLTARLKEKLEAAFFKGGAPTYEELQGIFYREYERWKIGQFKHLYESSREAFKIKFGEFLDDMMSSSPDKYVHRLLHDGVVNRKLMPCLIFDNTDHFPQKLQEAVFQYAQSLHRPIFSFVICPITDRTIWQLSKAGPLQSYVTTTFYLPVPSTREVLSKRVEFVKEKIRVTKSSAKGEYFLQKGIRLNISDLQAFAACIEEVFINTDYTSRTISWLSNHDIRRSLRISQAIMTAPAMTLEDLLKAYIAGHSFVIKPRTIMQALLFGDYNAFNQQSSDFVLNVFSIHANRLTSPLFKLSILRLLQDAEHTDSDPEGSYVTVENIQHYIEAMGGARNTTKAHLEELHRYRLIESYDPTDQTVYEEQRMHITPCGKIHAEMALDNENYVSCMSLATAIRNSATSDALRTIFNPARRNKEYWLELIRSFAEYCLEQDRLFIKIPTTPAYEGQTSLRIELRNRWVDHVGSLISGTH